MSTATANAGVEVPEDIFDMVFDASGVTQEKLEKTGGAGTINKDGKGHFFIKGIEKEKKDGVPCVRLDMECLAHEHEDQVGRVHFQRYNLAKKKFDGAGKLVGLEPLSDGMMYNIIKLFTNLGLVSKEDVVGVERVRLPWEKLEHFQLVAEIKNEPYDEKDKTTGQPTGKKIDSFRIPYGCNVWQVSDERVANVPKDPEALADFTGGAGIADVDDI